MTSFGRMSSVDAIRKRYAGIKTGHPNQIIIKDFRDFKDFKNFSDLNVCPKSPIVPNSTPQKPPKNIHSTIIWQAFAGKCACYGSMVNI